MISLKDASKPPGFTPATEHPRVRVAESRPEGAVEAYPVAISGPVLPQIGVERAVLEGMGFEGKVGQALVLPDQDGSLVAAVGIGDPLKLDTTAVRDVAAAFARAARKHARLAVSLRSIAIARPGPTAQAIVEGVLLARYSFEELKSKASATPLEELTLVVSQEQTDAVRDGAERGRLYAEAGIMARDLANAPPAYLTASRMADVATRIAKDTGLKAEVFDKDALERMGCGGLLGVNAGSAEPPRMIKLTYSPNGRRARAAGHLALVGKGIMYDSGGISLKPTDAVHATMKQDMSGAAAIMGAMSSLKALDCRTEVTGYLMCTDNMPSGSATKLGDVLTIRGGKTVEVMNTDAEGRLVMADALVLATEESPPPDAIVDIATLTGACLRALGPKIAGLWGNNQPLVEQVSASARSTDEPVWQMPLEREYRKELDSQVADMTNIGGQNGGAIHAALFLEEFVGALPWAHLDIAGPVLVDADEAWRPKGASGFGARLLLDLALNFKRPAA